MKSSLLIRIIFSVIITIFVLNFLVVVVYFPMTPPSISSPQISPLMLKLQSREAFGNFESIHLRKVHRKEQQSAPIKADERQSRAKKMKITKTDASEKGTDSTSNCPTYGCPVYPPELTTPITNETIRKALEASGYSGASPPETKQSLFKFEFASGNFATLSQQGASHEYNQDRALYISPFLPDLLTSTSNPKTKTESFLVCIFDGHGDLGHQVAQEAAEKFPLLLSEKLIAALGGDVTDKQNRSTKKNGKILVNATDYDSTDIAIQKALNETFLEINTKGNPSTFVTAGCTASVSLRWGSRLYIANTGDSETIVVSALPPSLTRQQQRRQQEQSQGLPTAKVEYATRRDKANQPAERARIENLGGKVHVNANGFDPRVIHYSESKHETVGLAMSRSIGDWEFEEVGVIAEPTIDVIDLSKPLLSNPDKVVFLMAACDGLWERRKKNFFASQMATSFHDTGEEEKSDKSLRPLYHLYDVIQRITPKRQDGYRDDITAVVVNLH